MEWLYAFAIVGVPLVVTELILRHCKKLSPEISRKIVHSVAAIASCLLLLPLSRKEIAILALIFSVIFVVVRWKRLFTSLYGVKRQTYGELFFPFGIIAASLISPDDSSYLAAVLILGLADTFASIMGQRYGKRKYSFFGSKKSYIGSLSFFTTSCALLLMIPIGVSVFMILVISALATLAEAFSPKGSDNLTVPFTVCLLLYVLH